MECHIWKANWTVCNKEIVIYQKKMHNLILKSKGSKKIIKRIKSLVRMKKILTKCSSMREELSKKKKNKLKKSKVRQVCLVLTLLLVRKTLENWFTVQNKLQSPIQRNRFLQKEFLAKKKESWVNQLRSIDLQLIKVDKNATTVKD